MKEKEKELRGKFNFIIFILFIVSQDKQSSESKKDQLTNRPKQQSGLKRFNKQLALKTISKTINNLQNAENSIFKINWKHGHKVRHFIQATLQQLIVRIIEVIKSVNLKENSK